MEFLFVVGFVALIYFGFQFMKTKNKYDNPLIELRKLYSDKYSDSDQIKMSYFVLASRFGCMPDEVKNYYYNELQNNNFNIAELIETEHNWKQKKSEEGALLRIKPDNTPAALLENWTIEYRNNNF